MGHQPSDAPSLTDVTASGAPTSGSSTYDLLIVGAGPAGSAAAITAAGQGLSVALVDKATFPRDKCCGDGLTTLALRQLEGLGLRPESVPQWFDVDGAWLRSPSGREVFVPLPDEGRFAAVAPRLELDDALVRRAREVGVEVIEGRSFVDLDQDSDRVDVTFDDGSRIGAPWLVAADGMWSPIRKRLGMTPPSYLGEWHAFRQYARNVTGPAASRLYVWFDRDLLPGYAWSFPLPGNRVNIGFGILRDGKRRVQDMKQTWSDLLQRPHVVEALGPDVEFEDRHTAWPIPARIDQAVTGVGRVLVVGDAAMATDSLTGEGIGQALLTGVEAVRAIVHGATDRRSADEVRRDYRRRIDAHLLADHRMSVRLSRVLAYDKGARGAITVLAHSGGWGRRNFARWMFEDEPRAIALTPRRWHRRLFRRTGTYQVPFGA
ncbi:MAG: hypothetical protein RIS41_883 [Actinomycetota bacterium]